MGNFKNLGVGKTFVLGSKKLQVKKSHGIECKKCFMHTVNNNCDDLINKGVIPECYDEARKDKKNVVFVEVSQKGEK